MTGCIVVASGLLAALLAQGGLFSADPGMPAHPDGLTTLALVLAILAFLVQIFVFILQTNAGNAAVRRSEELNSKTHAVLGKIESDSAATQRVLFSQFDRLLDYVVDRPAERVAVAELVQDEASEADSSDVSGDPPEGSAPVTAAEVQRIVGDALRPRERPSFEVAPRRESGPGDLKLVTYLRGWPSREEAEAAVPVLTRLSPLALTVLSRLCTQEAVQRVEGKTVGLLWGKVVPTSMQELIRAGLAREDNGVGRLTEHGREVARCIPIGKAMAEIPPWHDEVFAPLLRSP